VMPKGAGSENMSILAMLVPSQGLMGIKKVVLDAVVAAGGRPCPPTIVGIGIGGSADKAMLLAKKALLRPLHIGNRDAQLAALESELKQALNLTGIGPMGLGGKTTVLGVRVEEAYTHTASLPVAICLQCWAARRASARIAEDGSVTYSREGFW
ncbi:MAG: fumarate hydratase, partial [Methanomassiliicoccales archaeon]|nr:fumarate hydratase [Methanomassiliicoccales archaeon]